MIGKSHTLQTNPRHGDEELQNKQSQDTKKTNKANLPTLSLPHEDDCKTRKETKQCKTKYGTNA